MWYIRRMVPWAEDAVAGATNATVNYNYTGE